MRSSWTEEEKGRGRSETQTCWGEAMWRVRQRLEWRCPKPENTRDHRKLEETKDSPLEPPKRTWLCGHLDFGILASRTGSEYIPVIFRDQVYGNLLTAVKQNKSTCPGQSPSQCLLPIRVFPTDTLKTNNVNLSTKSTHVNSSIAPHGRQDVTQAPSHGLVCAYLSSHISISLHSSPLQPSHSNWASQFSALSHALPASVPLHMLVLLPGVVLSNRNVTKTSHKWESHICNFLITTFKISKKNPFNNVF